MAPAEASLMCDGFAALEALRLDTRAHDLVRNALKNAEKKPKKGRKGLGE